ncbi:dihydropteroate synthase [Lentilactobacillus parafarraginis]|jgi:dihydropteroate synthase|uniref:dihydropteroate synthase n=1 Tax=Lentilactobacillus parafarraginis TaxID=390842 RepID=UPI0014863A41|nr:dihydropteroate synthase [Lentilactobacillus parafarraginis]
MKISQLQPQKATIKSQIKIGFTTTFDEAEKLRNLVGSNYLSIASSLNNTTLLLTRDQLNQLIKKWPSMFDDAQSIHTLKQIETQSQLHFRGQEFDFDITDKPLIYSILNLTPDSFYDGGRNDSVDGVLKRIETEMSLGASIFEVGGKSSKPHFDDIPPKEEWARIEPFLTAIHHQFPKIVLAIDSNTPEVIELALDNGIQIINDIDGFNSKRKLDLVAKYKPSVVTMFNGRNFDEEPDTLIRTMTSFFTNTISNLTGTGIEKEQIVLDPGVGFSDHNTLAFDLMKMRFTKLMSQFDLPIMIAISRKSFAKRLFNLQTADERLIPTLLFESFMTVLGGRIIRTHDVRETSQLIQTFNLLKSELLS